MIYVFRKHVYTLHQSQVYSVLYIYVVVVVQPIDLSTARPKWRLDRQALSGQLLYSLVNHAFANRYHHHLVR